MVDNQIVTQKTKKILIIDDESQFCEDLPFLLDGPYKIAIATGSQEGMRLVQEIEPDLIILDLVMPAHFATDPENEGLEVLKKLKGGDHSQIPVIVLTKMVSALKKAECLDFGAEEFLRKPPLIEELIEKISEMTES